MKLITLDLDGTLLPNDTAFAAVLRANGKKAEVEASDAAYFAGTLSLEDCFWQQWDMVKQLSLADMSRAMRHANWLPDITAGVKALKATGAKVALLTDQPSVLSDYLGRWGLIDAICSPVTVKEGECIAIDAQFDKWANLKLHLDDWHIAPADVCHIGNGSNDVPVWERVGKSIAVFAEPEVAKHATFDFGQPASLLEIAGKYESTSKLPHTS